MPEQPERDDSGERVRLRQLPWQIRLFLDIVMLRSTPVTAVFWCGFLVLTTLHVAWSCGLLTPYGFDAGFVRVNDQVTAKQEAENRIAGVEQKTEKRIASAEGKIDWQLKLTVTKELRDTTAVLCKTRDDSQRQGLQSYIDQLVEEYTRITGKSIAPPPCPPK